ncbi:MAG: hypothetical protein WCY93_10670 [Anaerolineaceae bacterium]
MKVFFEEGARARYEGTSPEETFKRLHIHLGMGYHREQIAVREGWNFMNQYLLMQEIQEELKGSNE